MPGDNNEEHILVMLGRIEGQIKGIQDLVSETSKATNKRIDDLKDSVNRRIDDHQQDTSARFKEVNTQINKRSVVAGSASAAMVTGAIEFIRITLSGSS